jgi:hypothetical protein
MSGVLIRHQNRPPFPFGIHRLSFYRLYHPGGPSEYCLVHRRYGQRIHGLPESGFSGHTRRFGRQGDVQIFLQKELINLDYSRAKIAAAAREWPMKLYFYTANGLQRSRCSEIGSPEGQKMPINIKKILFEKFCQQYQRSSLILLKKKLSAFFMNNSG